VPVYVLEYFARHVLRLRQTRGIADGLEKPFIFLAENYVRPDEAGKRFKSKIRERGQFSKIIDKVSGSA